MAQSFPGFTESDFDAYQPSRATSNAYVRPRLPVKEKLLAMGRELAERARSNGIALEVQGSDERPSIWNKKSVTEQWVFLWRDRDARAELERAAAPGRDLGAALMDPTPFYKHAFLALCLNSERFEVAFRIHNDAWADVKNVRSRMETPVGQGAVTAALAKLPPEFQLGVNGDKESAARESNPASITAMLESANQRASWLYVSRTIAKPESVALGDGLQRWIEDAFDALIPVYKVMAWRREDDLADVQEDLVRGLAAREAHAVELAAREAAWVAQHNADIERRREQAVNEARERVSANEPARASAIHALSIDVPAAPRRPEREVRPDSVRPKADKRVQPSRPQPGSRPRAEAPSPKPNVPQSATPPAAKPKALPTELVEGDGPVAMGARVKIRTGPFAGKVGTVVELDAKGLAKVSLGILSARVETGDLVAMTEKR